MDRTFRKAYSASSRKGFSLVEMVLAIAIVGFCLSTLMGMLPIGLSAFQASRERTLTARMFQTVANQLQLSSNVPAAGNGYFDQHGDAKVYFDVNGDVVTTPTSAIYLANVFIISPSYSLPHSDAVVIPSQVTRVEIQICPYRGGGQQITYTDNAITSVVGNDLRTRAVYVP